MIMEITMVGLMLQVRWFASPVFFQLRQSASLLWKSQDSSKSPFARLSFSHVEVHVGKIQKLVSILQLRGVEILKKKGVRRIQKELSFLQFLLLINVLNEQCLGLLSLTTLVLFFLIFERMLEVLQLFTDKKVMIQILIPFWQTFTHFSNISHYNKSYRVFYFLDSFLHFTFYQEIICFLSDVKIFPRNCI